jgi:PIN domain nuclease of toxin-antitoxin system
MKILLDTHVLLWCLSEKRHLSSKAAEEFLYAGNNLYFSAASYWEICLKISIGKLDLEPNWERAIEREMSRNSIQWLNLEKSHFLTIIGLPWRHRDPFDRLLVAQAMCEHMAIMTSDVNFRRYAVKSVW